MPNEKRHDARFFGGKFQSPACSQISGGDCLDQPDTNGRTPQNFQARAQGIGEGAGTHDDNLARVDTERC